MNRPYRITRRRSRALSLGNLPILEPPSPGWRRLLRPPDPLHMEAGAKGELLVARIRLLVVASLLVVSIGNVLLGHLRAESLVVVAALFATLLFGLAVFLLLKRDVYRPWLGVMSSLVDVSAVTLALGAFLLLDRPLTTVNSRPTFECYFLAIGATALRYDSRICLVAGMAAITEYLILVLVAVSGWDLAQLGSIPGPFGQFDWATQVARLVLLGAASLLAWAVVRRSQTLRFQSRSDRLTGLPNRAYLDEQMEVMLSRARRLGEPLSVAMIDIDHFKVFNDTWGHAVGDLALRTVALAIQAAIREEDLVVRYGGEEFAAVLPGMDQVGARARVEEIRVALEATPLTIPRRSEIAHLTISAGLASYGADGTVAEDLIDRADARLLAAKREGRNRVVSEGPGWGGRTADRPAVGN